MICVCIWPGGLMTVVVSPNNTLSLSCTQVQFLFFQYYGSMAVLIRNYLNKETLVADIVHILLFDDCTKSVTTLRLTRPSVDRDKYRSRLKKLTWQLGVMSSDGHWDFFCTNFAQTGTCNCQSLSPFFFIRSPY